MRTISYPSSDSSPASIASRSSSPLAPNSGAIIGWIGDSVPSAASVSPHDSRKCASGSFHVAAATVSLSPTLATMRSFARANISPNLAPAGASYNGFTPMHTIVSAPAASADDAPLIASSAVMLSAPVIGL